MEEEKALSIINGYKADSYDSYNDLKKEIDAELDYNRRSGRKNTMKGFVSSGAGAFIYNLPDLPDEVATTVGTLILAYGAVNLAYGGLKLRKSRRFKEVKKDIEEEGFDQVLEEKKPLEFVRETLS